MIEQRPGQKQFADPGPDWGVQVIEPTAAAIWLPSNIANLGLWLRADLGTFQDAAMTIPATLNGDPVGGWQDQSGSGNHATQAIAAQQPNLMLNIINGMPTIRLTAASQDFLEILTGAALGITDTVTAFFAQIPNNTGVRMTMLGQRNLANACSIESDASANPYRATIIPGAFVARTVLGALPCGAWEILTYRRVGPGAGTHIWRADGVNIALFNNAANAYAANGIKDIGRRAVGSQHFDGDFAEILIYTTNLSDAQIGLVEGWLNGRYAIF